MRHEAEMQAILKQVEVLEPHERRWLVEKIREAGELSIPPFPIALVPAKQRTSLNDLIGIANPTKRHISDEDVKRWRDESLEEKYGPFPKKLSQENVQE